MDLGTELLPIQKIGWDTCAPPSAVALHGYLK
jgi:hypothetical protein